MTFLFKFITRKNLIYVAIVLVCLLIAALGYGYANQRGIANTAKVEKFNLEEKIKEKNKLINELGEEITKLLQAQELMNEALTKTQEEAKQAGIAQLAIQTDFSGGVDEILADDKNYVYLEEVEYTFSFDPVKPVVTPVKKVTKKKLTKEAEDAISDKSSEAMWKSYCNKRDC